jgi:ADP-heptose:LPS heptosyltransferase
LTIDELAALMERANLFVGADSGPAHLAAAVGTPAVVLFSGTNDSRQWRPAGRDVRVVQHPTVCAPCHRETCPVEGHPCMERLSPEEVAAAITQLLSDLTMRVDDDCAHS